MAGFPISNDPIYNVEFRAKHAANPAYDDPDDELGSDTLGAVMVPRAVVSVDNPAAAAAQPTEPLDESYLLVQVDIDSLDPSSLCLDCTRTFKDPLLPEEMLIYLHALSYTSSEWSFKTKPPAWASLPDKK